MTRPKRDEFLEKVKRALALRVGYRCSFSGCDVSTTGPSEESSSAFINIGVAAHIHAASPGGPRFLDTMTPEERKDISNGIWLCANHGLQVDRDEVSYTADQLRSMKLEAERRASAKLGHIPSSKDDIDFVAIGSNLVCTGQLIGTTELEWRLRIDHFLIGDLCTLINFCEQFDRIAQYDRFVLINALGDGRQLSAAPKWQRTDSNDIILSFSIFKSFPRLNAHNLPVDFALNHAHDLFLDNGNIATLSGLAALPQTIKTCLSTLRGEMPLHLTFGSRIKEYFDKFQNSPWLSRLIKLEVIRLACLPSDDSITQQHTSLRCVRRVLRVEQLPSEQGGDWLLFSFDLELEGVGSWQCEIPIFVPSGERTRRIIA
ncbi:MAG TPA: hypothetical protein VHE99_02895 [Gammaproteobacteria bacterium]|nr:hypothetical protein [Gammaproteobacteria bacterium]